MRDTELKHDTGEHRGSSSYWSPAGCRCNAWLRTACGKPVRKAHLGTGANGSHWVGMAPLLVLQVTSELGLAPSQNATKAF